MEENKLEEWRIYIIQLEVSLQHFTANLWFGGMLSVTRSVVCVSVCVFAQNEMTSELARHGGLSQVHMSRI